MENNNFNAKINVNNLCKFVMFVFIFSLYTIPSLKGVTFSVFVFVFSLYLLMRGVKLSLYTLWSIILFLIVLLSNLWSLAPENSLMGTRAIIKIALIGNLLIPFLNARSKFVFLLKCFSFSGVGLVFRLIFMFPISTWGSMRLGNESLNSNMVGLYLTLSVLSMIHLAIDSKIRKKIFYYLLIFVFSIVIILTGSRKAFLFLVLGSTLLNYLNIKNRTWKVLVLLIIIVTFIIGYEIIMTVPFFYNILGVRIEGLINAFTGDGVVDASTMIRRNLVEIGMNLYRDRPYFGYGIASYTTVSGQGIYSHNNFIELLVGIGAIGTVIYYSLYSYIIIKLVQLKKDNLLNYYIVYILLLVVMEYGLVSYFDEIYHIIIASSFALIQISNKNTNYKRKGGGKLDEKNIDIN